MAACSRRGDEETADTTAVTIATTAATAASSAAPGTTDTTGATATTAGTDTAAPTTEAAPAGPMFGTMPSPCSPAGSDGVPTVAKGQNGGNPLRLGTAGDHGFEAPPGLTLEMLDAQAFAASSAHYSGRLWKMRNRLPDGSVNEE